jgi:general secretion pathway protein H
MSGHDQDMAGFTLVELLVVMTILALVAGLAMPILARPSATVRLQTAARDLIGALRATRAAAIARNAEVMLTIDVERRSFESPAVPRRSFARDIAARVTFAEPERQGRTAGGFRFFADGSATGGDVRLALDGGEARICLDWFTGEARTC